MKNILASIVVLVLATVACNLTTAVSNPQAAASIGGTISADLNGNGILGGDEGPLDNVIVSLSGCGENKTAVSGTDGIFQFNGLPAGICVLEVTKAGWTYSASFPTAGYPIPVTADTSHPTTVVIYMRPLDQTQPEPAPAASESAVALTATLPATPTEMLPTATPTATGTPTVPMVSAIDKGVNCRFGPGLEYLAIDALLVGSPVPIIGRTEDSYWWQVDGPSFGNGKCFVAANVTQTAGNLGSIPVVQSPDPYVTDVKVSVKVTEGLNCTSVHKLDIAGTFSTNGPATVKYHWVLTGAITDTTPTETIDFSEAGEKQVTVPGAVTQCGDYALELQVEKPNQISGKDTFSVHIP